MFFHLGYQHDDNGWVGVAICSKAHAQMKALFTSCGGIILWPINDMFIIAPNGSLENVAIETPNPLVEGKYISRFQVEGFKFPPHIQITEKVLIDP